MRILIRYRIMFIIEDVELPPQRRSNFKRWAKATDDGDWLPIFWVKKDDFLSLQRRPSQGTLYQRSGKQFAIEVA